MLSGTTVILMHYSFITLVFLSVIASFFFFFRKDAPKQGKSAILWTVLTVFFSSFAPAIYFFVTKRIKWALFWLIVFPVMFYFAQIGVFIATEEIPHTHAEGQGHGESAPYPHEEGNVHDSEDSSHTENHVHDSNVEEHSHPDEEVISETNTSIKGNESIKIEENVEIKENKKSEEEGHTHTLEHGDDGHTH